MDLSDFWFSGDGQHIWIDHAISTHKIWAIASVNLNYYPHTPTIYQFDDTNFLLQKSYFYSDFYKLNVQTAVYEVKAHYLFANSAGTELSVLRKGTDNNNWSIEFIPVE